MPLVVDGHLTESEEITSLKVLNLIAWMEVYPRIAGLPQDLLPVGTMLRDRNDCGVIFVWTKRYLKP